MVLNCRLRVSRDKRGPISALQTGTWKRRRPLAVALDNPIGGRIGENFTQKPVGDAVARPSTGVVTKDRRAGKCQVAKRVEHFATDVTAQFVLNSFGERDHKLVVSSIDLNHVHFAIGGQKRNALLDHRASDDVGAQLRR